MASQDDDLERLLREVEAATSGTAPKRADVPATTGGATPARQQGEAAGGRFAMAVRTGLVSGGIVAALVFGFVFFLQWLPFIDNPLSSAIGAFVGGFLTGFVLRYRSHGTG